MNLKSIISCMAAGLMSATVASAQTTIADWTFEASLPSGTLAANSWATNIVPEIGTGTGAAHHILASSACALLQP